MLEAMGTTDDGWPDDVAAALTALPPGHAFAVPDVLFAKISDDQLFYCRSRGIGEEDAVSLIVDGFCKQVFRELPMEFAVEAKKLLEVSLEGSVG